MKSPHKLTDTQRIVLSAASQREDRRVIMPDSLRAAAADKVLATLTAKGLIEPAANSRKRGRAKEADISGLTPYCISAAGLARVGIDDQVPVPVLRGKPEHLSPSATVKTASHAPEGVAGNVADRGRHDDVDHQPLGGSDVPAKEKAGDPPSGAIERPASDASAGKASARALPTSATETSYHAPRPGTKLDRVIFILARENGATIDELMEATGWLPHTARAALTGLRRRGYDVQLDRAAGKQRASVYRIASARALAS